ncbi:hypothetical protein TRIUR3_04945 [Triticum urartu]|uniref:Uncharacterized protein n=1 Tax=Triticum urartu TaxID=4572 RepID=M7ZQ71_TRIUA|nr:hypothetical protein TRIUR3_04945 [Triticum urartu]
MGSLKMRERQKTVGERAHAAGRGAVEDAVNEGTEDEDGRRKTPRESGGRRKRARSREEGDGTGELRGYLQRAAEHLLCGAPVARSGMCKEEALGWVNAARGRVGLVKGGGETWQTATCSVRVVRPWQKTTGERGEHGEGENGRRRLRRRETRPAWRCWWLSARRRSSDGGATGRPETRQEEVGRCTMMVGSLGKRGRGWRLGWGLGREEIRCCGWSAAQF